MSLGTELLRKKSAYIHRYLKGHIYCLSIIIKAMFMKIEPFFLKMQFKDNNRGKAVLLKDKHTPIKQEHNLALKKGVINIYYFNPLKSSLWKAVQKVFPLQCF